MTGKPNGTSEPAPGNPYINDKRDFDVYHISKSGKSYHINFIKAIKCGEGYIAHESTLYKKRKIATLLDRIGTDSINHIIKLDDLSDAKLQRHEKKAIDDYVSKHNDKISLAISNSNYVMKKSA